MIFICLCKHREIKIHPMRLIIFLEMFAQPSCIHNTWNNLKGASLRPYKLEIIFSPSFFDPMEHLPIHLVYEAKVKEPMQYKWMHLF